MHLLRLDRTFPKLKNITRQASQALNVDENEYTKTPNYPPILDMSLQARKRRDREAVYKKIQKLKTVEEKQIALNLPRYYGFKSIMLYEDKVPYNALPLVKCYTRSHFIPIDKLPEVYSEHEASADSVLKEIKSSIEDAISIEMEGVQRSFTPSVEKSEVSQKEDAVAKCVVRQINRIICNNLADKAPHILSAQVDYDPRHEGFWFVGGVDVPNNVVSWRRQYSWLKDRLDENVDTAVQYMGSPFVALRSNVPLKPILPYSEADNPELKVAMFNYRPEMIGYSAQHRHGTNIPGFWPGDNDEFGLLSIHGRGHILDRPAPFGEQDNIEALHCQALKASFGWLLGQASFQGFTPYNDITYPLVTQTVLTNGQLWSLYAYQLNTVTMHNEQIEENPKHNVCFGTKPLKLYDTIEDGKVKGLNDDTLKMLIQFYLNTPEERDHELKPYLGRNVKVVADIEKDQRRAWLEDKYKHLVSNRPRHNLPYEIYHWERIYKIEHNTRFFERKVRPFELGVNPYKRRLDEHLPPYIPKALRPYPRHGKKFESTFYPKIFPKEPVKKL